MKKIIKFLIPVLILGLAVAGFIYMKKTKPEQPAVEVKEKVWMVHSQAIHLESLPAVQTLYGVIESNAMVDAAAPISAVVEQVKVLPGDEIKKGQMLVALAKPDLDLPVTQASADRADARAQVALQEMTMQANQQKLQHEQKVLELKQEALQRTNALMAKDLASQSAVDAAKEALVKQEFSVVGVELLVQQGESQLSQTKARLQKAEAAYSLAKLNQKRGVVRAPFDGRIAAVNVAEGDRVNAGSVLVSFYALKSMELKTQLATQGYQEAQQALAQGVKLYAEFPYAKGTVQLALERLSGQAKTSGVDAYFSLPQELRFKRPGELLEVYFKGEAIQQVAAIPYSAVYGNDRIYLVEDGRLKAQKVVLKGDVMRDGKLMALIQGVGDSLAGKRVLTTHLPNAIEGLRVTEVQ